MKIIQLLFLPFYKRKRDGRGQGEDGGYRVRKKIIERKKRKIINICSTVFFMFIEENGEEENSTEKK